MAIKKKSTRGFQPGNTLAKGVVRRNGRAEALKTLDDMLKKASNQKRLYLDLQRSFQEKPMWFFQKIIMPLIPKEQLLKIEGELNADMGVTILEALRKDIQRT